MAKREVAERVCDRCPKNRPQPATELVRFGIADRQWEIDLCAKHYRDLDRDIYGWALMAREVEEPVAVKRFTEETIEAGRRLAELRARQAPEPELKKVPAKAMHLSGPLPEGLPPEAGEWVFTDHAVMRMKERKVSAVQALRAACTPTIIRESEDPTQRDLTIHIRDGIKVVVNEVDQVVITVAKEDRVAWSKTS